MVDSDGFIDSKAFWNSMFWTMFSTANQWEVTKTIFLYFYHYCRYLNQIWSAHRYNTVILAGQVSRQILQGDLLRFTPTHHWQFWVVMINGGESAYFQTDLLDFDAFLTILILSGIPCGVIPDFTHRRTDWGWLSTHGVAVHFKWPMNQLELNISPEIWLAGFSVFVQKACQISLGYFLNRPHD